MPPLDRVPDGSEPRDDISRGFVRETLEEGRKEFSKRLVQGSLVLAAVIVSSLLAAGYFLIVEPKLARHIAHIITDPNIFAENDPKGNRAQANPLDDYILKVFLTAIAQEKASSSENARKIIDAVNDGHIREAFSLFSQSMGQEIDVLDQIKIEYQHPTTVQIGTVSLEVSPNPKYKSSASPGTPFFSVLVSRGQTLEIFAIDLRIDILAPNNQDVETGPHSVDLVIKCYGCDRRTIDIPNIRNIADFGRRNLTQYLDWSSADSAQSGVKHIALDLAAHADENTNFKFSATFVVLVENALPKHLAVDRK